MRYIYLVVMIIASTIMCIRSLVYTQMNGYRLRLTGGILREMLILVLSFILVETLSLILYIIRLESNITYVILTISIIVLCILCATRGYKVSPNYTPRLRRLIGVFSLINTIYLCVIGCIAHLISDEISYMSIVSGTILFEYLFMILSLTIVGPFENRANKKKIEESTARLRQMESVKVIGITGSFGKTSVKNILNTILSVKYNVKCTPQSYNTPVGVAISIDNLIGDEDYFIVEMGAKHIGDIRELVSMVRPTYGIITGVTAQHLSTFVSIENIVHEKYELFKGVTSKCVFNSHNDMTCDMYNQSDSSRSMLSPNNDVYIDNVNIMIHGMTFDLHICGETRACVTRLVGRQYVEDIEMSVALASKLNMSIDEIVRGISDIAPIPHRFEVTNAGGIYIIDDSYNANIVGVEAGLETLSHFDGRKIVATQGIVEAGREQNNLNREIGVKISDAADIVILIGKNRRYIMDGLISQNFNMTNVFSVGSLKDAKRIFTALLKRGDILYITNDLPDNY